MTTSAITWEVRSFVFSPTAAVTVRLRLAPAEGAGWKRGKSFTVVEQEQMKKHQHTVWQGEGEDKGDDLFKWVLIGFVNVKGFFLRSIFNKYTVRLFCRKWLEAKQESILLLVRSRPGSQVFLGFSPGFLSYFWQHFPSLTLCISILPEVARQFTGAGFLSSRSHVAFDCHHQWRRNPAAQVSCSEVRKAYILITGLIFSLRSVCQTRKRKAVSIFQMEGGGVPKSRDETIPLSKK